MGNGSHHAQEVTVALAGNPNAGKTSLFNALTGARQHVGNYPGVTVERRTGHYEFEGRRYNVVDLPGTYSLTSYSPEERIAQLELLEHAPEVVVAVVDETALKRSLVLVAQLMHLTGRMVLCLNMADEARMSGQKLDIALLERLLGMPVVETVGHKQQGMDGLVRAIARAASQERVGNRLVLGERLDAALRRVREAVAGAGIPPERAGWDAVKLLENDPGYTSRYREKGGAFAAAVAAAARERKRIEAATGMDITLFMAECYFGFVDGLLREVVVRQPREDARAVSDRIDDILVNRVLGIPFFLAVMYLVFWTTFTVGEYPMDWLEAGFDLLGKAVGGLWAPGSDAMLRSLIVDGVIGGVGGVLVFLPNIVLLFLSLTFLEDTGYMARAAFLVDRVMHRFGLHGRSFIPLVTGFGCSIPGIMATRTLENERDRLTTMLVLPLMSCGARLPIWMLLIPAFFPPAWRAPALWLIYAVGIVLALLFALLLRRSILKGEEAPFVMELPPYRLPTLRSVIGRAVQRAWMYLKKAGTLILAISVVMWFLLNTPADVFSGKTEAAALDRAPDSSSVNEPGRSTLTSAEPGEIVGGGQPAASVPGGATSDDAERARAAEEMRRSLAGRIGRLMEPVIAPLGFDWKLGTAMLGAFAAKEGFVAQLGVIYAMGEVDETSDQLRDALHRDYSRLTAVSLMLFLLIATPCMATVAVMRRETGGWKWPLVQFFGLTATGYLVSLVVYQVGRTLF